MSMPPPMPGAPVSPGAAPPRRRMSGCAIVAIAGAAMAVLAIPAIGILAAIALPAYQDYVTRSKVQVGYIRAQALETEIDRFREAQDRCPYGVDIGLDSRGIIELGGIRDGVPSQAFAGIESAEGGGCTLSMRFEGVGLPSGQNSLLFERDGSGVWRCTGGTMANKARPPACRTDRTE